MVIRREATHLNRASWMHLARCTLIFKGIPSLRKTHVVKEHDSRHTMGSPCSSHCDILSPGFLYTPSGVFRRPCPALPFPRVDGSAPDILFYAGRVGTRKRTAKEGRKAEDSGRMDGWGSSQSVALTLLVLLEHRMTSIRIGQDSFRNARPRPHGSDGRHRWIPTSIVLLATVFLFCKMRWQCGLNCGPADRPPAQRAG